MTSHDYRGAVVVGVDDSTSSDGAVRAAAELAHRENRRLHIVHGYDASPTVYPAVGMGLNLHEYMAAIRQAAEDVLANAMAVASDVRHDVKVSGTLCAVDPREALVQMSETASIVVVGSRGRGPLRRMVLGSVSMWVTQHAHCPVLVVREPGREGASPVVVGVDGSEVSTPALEFAFGQASWRRAPLVVVHCFAHTFRGGYGLTGALDPDLDDLPGERRSVAESVAGLQEKYPDVDVTFEVTPGSAAAHLVELSAQSGLLVVGSRHLSRAGAIFGGSVSRPVIEHAHCSVAVVPAS